VRAAIVREVGLKGPPPPLIVMVVEPIGLQFAGEGLALGDGLADGLGVALVEGLGVCPYAVATKNARQHATAVALKKLRCVSESFKMFISF